jgi:adenosine deaminase
MASSNQNNFKNFPKVELHRHLEGSVRVETLREIVHQFNIPLPPEKDLRQLVQVTPNEPYNMVNFLSKFQILRQFYQTPEIIQRVAYEAVADAALDGIRYIEVMFTPVALARIRSFPMDEVIEWVIAGTHQANHDYGIQSRLIVSINRHEDIVQATQVARLACRYFQKGVVALNLAGNEADFPATPFAQIFQSVHAHGLGVTIHAGEWNSAENVREAIVDLKADRIGHGVRVVEDPIVVDLARNQRTPFEVCLTSNLQTGVIQNISEHPVLRMLNAGLNVTFNTDDPAISGITLSNEFNLAHHTLGIPTQTLAKSTLTAVEGTFLTHQEKDELLSDIRQRLAPYL